VDAGVLDVGEVLHEVAAERHVEQLHAPADRQQWQVPVQRGLQRVELRLVPLRPQHRGVRSGRLSVPGGVDVGPTGDDQSVEPRDHLGGEGAGGQQHGFAPGPGDGVGIRRGQQDRRHVPRPPPCLLAVRRDADQRAHAPSVPDVVRGRPVCPRTDPAGVDPPQQRRGIGPQHEGPALPSGAG
jgi:hypothetical protein